MKRQGNKTKFIPTLLIFCLIVLSFPSAIMSTEMSSEHYRILDSSINVGGQDIQTSTSYRMRESIGEPVAGESTSTSYILRAGYQPMLESYISLAVSTTSVQMLPSISGMTGGAATGTFSATVATDNPAGYSLYVSASTSPAMQSGSDSFADYTPGTEAAWYSDYSYRKKITIDESKIDSDLTDFPVLVQLSSSTFDFSKARSDGYDIIFAGDNGTSLLKYEREKHDSTNSEAVYWVKIPSVSSTASTSFYIYYGKATASDGSDKNNVWDSSFKLVQHLGESPANGVAGYIDSTSYANNGTPYNFDENASSTTNTAGKINGADLFDGSDDYINIPSSAGDELDATSSFTVEVWIKASSCPASGTVWPNMVSRRAGGTWSSYVLGIDSGTYPALFFNYGSIFGALWSWNVCNDVWHYVAAVHDDAADLTKMFVDGSKAASTTVSVNPTTSNTNMHIGNNYGGGGYFKGRIDEVRFSQGARSEAWMKATYNSGNDSLISFSVEEARENIVPDFSWSVLSSDSEFGFTPEGSDIVQRFKDNGSDTCATGTSDTADKCWFNFSSSNLMVSRIYSSNNPFGSQTTIKLKAESGSNRFQAMGTYRAHIITTAFGN